MGSAHVICGSPQISKMMRSTRRCFMMRSIDCWAEGPGLWRALRESFLAECRTQRLALLHHFTPRRPPERGTPFRGLRGIERGQRIVPERRVMFVQHLGGE